METDKLQPVFLWAPKLSGVHCDPVTEFDKSLAELVAQCIQTMHYYGGVGLAAAQIGKFVRVAVAEHEDKRVVLINPELSSLTGNETGFEGCLSLPGVTASGTRIHNGGRLARCTDIEYFTHTLTGKRVKKEAHGFMARVIQHEIDHMSGIFVVDRMSAMYRSIVMRNFENFKKQIQDGAVPV